MERWNSSNRLACLLAVLSGAVAASATAADRCIDSRQYLPQVRPGAPVLGPPGGPVAGVEYNVGDQFDWYIWRLAGFPQADLKPCTIRGKGPRVYVVVENGAWNLGLVDQADIDTVVDAFENSNFTTTRTGGIYDLGVEAFGTPPLGLDQKERIYLLYHDFDVSSDGFFWVFDSSPDGTTPPFGSNECEVLYLNCGPDAGVDHDPSSRYMIGVVAHEFEHLIHNAYDGDESGWVDEGLAEYAMFHYGADDPSWIASFLSRPDVALIPPSGNGVHYGALWFWTVYLAGNYGDTALTRDLVLEPANGIAGIDTTLAARGFSERFPDVFRDWTVANLIDAPSLPGGRFGYPDYDFAPLTFAASHATYPVAAAAGDVRRWAADYLSFSSYGSLQVDFDGSDSDTFSLRAVELDDQGLLPPRVTDVVLDPARLGTATAPSAPGYETLVVIPAALDPSASVASYTYGATATTVPTPIVLHATKRRPPDDPARDLDLIWSGGTAPFDLFRATAKSDIGNPAFRFQSGVMSPTPVLGEAETPAFFWVEGR